MAAPWYPSEFPLSHIMINNHTEKPTPRFLSEIIDNNNHKSRRNALSIDSLRKVLARTNHLLTLPETEVDKITPVTENREYYEDDEENEENEENFYHSGLINKTLRPMRIVLMIVGRWPFLMKLKRVPIKRHGKHHHGTDNDNRQNHHHNHHQRTTRVYFYDPSLKSLFWIYFALSTLFLLFILIVSTLSFFDVFLGWGLLPPDKWALITKTEFRNNLVMFLLVWGCLLHGVVSSACYLFQRKLITNYFNYWNLAADELLMLETTKQRRFLFSANAGYLGFLILIYIAYSWWQIPIVRDGAELFGKLALRSILSVETVSSPCNTYKLRIFGIATMIYAIYSSRANLFIFCFKCRLLRALFRLWNGRMRNFLRMTEESDYSNHHKDDKESREMLEKAESQRLLEDMAVLLQLVRKTDRVFARILQAYYTVQLINMCFELYMLTSTGSISDETKRRLDLVAALVALFQNVFFFFTVSLDGARVGEEADKGMELLRSHHVSPDSSAYRKYLVYNLNFIYSQRIAITGGKYFTLDRPFIITMLGAVITYFIIILQVRPSFNED